MPESITTAYDYKRAARDILASLRRDRDRQIIAKRFGFDLAKRQTLEQIGRQFGITRERVRQIEKASLSKLRTAQHPEVSAADSILREIVSSEGGIIPAQQAADRLGASDLQTQSYVSFLAALAPGVSIIEENDHLRSAYGLAELWDDKSVSQTLQDITQIITLAGKPLTAAQIASRLGDDLTSQTVINLAGIDKGLASHDGHWGLISWPQVNPKSIRDKTYLVMNKHGRPLHFSDIAGRIKNSNFTRRDVTVQAVHNELIKDSRFVLIGRGIYALAEWGYTPGTVADIIIEVLREQSPLHKDEIISRVLQKRQVKTTTILLNLQEKDQFERVAKATYKLKGQ